MKRFATALLVIAIIFALMAVAERAGAQDTSAKVREVVASVRGELLPDTKVFLLTFNDGSAQLYKDNPLAGKRL